MDDKESEDREKFENSELEYTGHDKLFFKLERNKDLSKNGSFIISVLFVCSPEQLNSGGTTFRGLDSPDSRFPISNYN